MIVIPTEILIVIVMNFIAWNGDINFDGYDFDCDGCDINSDSNDFE